MKSKASPQSGEKCGKVAKKVAGKVMVSGKKLGKVIKVIKVMKNNKKMGKVGKGGEKCGRVAESGGKW